MRTYIRMALVNDAVLAGLGVVDAGVVSGDADSNTERPLLNLQWGETTPGMGPVNRRFLVIWAHDVPGSYERIDKIVRRIRIIMASLIGGTSGGGHLVLVEWVTDSSDLRNDDRGTILRTSTYRVVASGW